MNKKLVISTLAGALAASMLTSGAFAYYSSRTAIKQNAFSIVEGEKNQTDGGVINEPSWDHLSSNDNDKDGIPDQADSLQPGQSFIKDPSLTNNTSYSAYAFLKITVPTGTVKEAGSDATKTAELIQINKQKRFTNSTKSSTSTADGKYNADLAAKNAVTFTIDPTTTVGTFDSQTKKLADNIIDDPAKYAVSFSSLKTVAELGKTAENATSSDADNSGALGENWILVKKTTGTGFNTYYFAYTRPLSSGNKTPGKDTDTTSDLFQMLYIPNFTSVEANAVGGTELDADGHTKTYTGSMDISGALIQTTGYDNYLEAWAAIEKDGTADSPSGTAKTFTGSGNTGKIFK